MADMKTYGMVFQLLTLVVCAHNALPAPANIKVSGSVLDAERNVASHAYIEVLPFVDPDRSGGTVGDLPWIAVDTSGHFDLTLAPGRYRIKAKDETDGYPDPSFCLNVDPKAKFPVISGVDNEVRDVEVRLGSQGGILTGVVKDIQTQKSLACVQIRIQDARNSDAYVEISSDRTGHFQCAIPRKPVVISAAARGYKCMVFENGEELSLSSGEHRAIEVELEHE
jgi:hypothetical protein